MSKEEQWREEAIEILNSSDPIDPDFVGGYLAACKKRDEEIEKLKVIIDEIDTNLLDKHGEISRLKEQLKLERCCVDFYASEGNWFESEYLRRNVIRSSDCDNNEDFCGGDFARSVQAQRKVSELKKEVL